MAPGALIDTYTLNVQSSRLDPSRHYDTNRIERARTRIRTHHQSFFRDDTNNVDFESGECSVVWPEPLAPIWSSGT